MPLSSLGIALGHSLHSVNFIQVHFSGSDLNSVCWVPKLFSTDTVNEMQRLLSSVCRNAPWSSPRAGCLGPGGAPVCEELLDSLTPRSCRRSQGEILQNERLKRLQTLFYSHGEISSCLITTVISSPSRFAFVMADFEQSAGLCSSTLRVPWVRMLLH